MILELQNKLSLYGYVSEHYVCVGQIYSLGLLIKENIKQTNQVKSLMLVIFLKYIYVSEFTGIVSFFSSEIQRKPPGPLVDRRFHVGSTRCNV